MHLRPTCHFPLVRINGRTLKAVLTAKHLRQEFSTVVATKWFELCPKCCADILGAGSKSPLPFLCDDGVMRTCSDLNEAGSRFSSTHLDFAGFKFSKSALDTAMRVFQNDQNRTTAVETLGAGITTLSTHSDLLTFGESVCEWGRGQRVWANLLRHNGRGKLARQYSSWFDVVRDSNDSAEAIAPYKGIKGLGVSFASKHLRMLDPQKYAVLDDVLSQGLGFALNAKGYGLFMSLLLDFSVKNELSNNFATIEGGIFVLVRQNVRAQ